MASPTLRESFDVISNEGDGGARGRDRQRSQGPIVIGVVLLVLVVMMALSLKSCAATEAPVELLLPDIERKGVKAVQQWARDRTGHAQNTFEGLRHESPINWAQSIVYQIQVDRFNNGDSSNDLLNIPLHQKQAQKQGTLEDLPAWRHGGDFAGIKQRLEYIKDLGINTLWLTPVLDHNGDYHAYCLTDPTTTDPGFGSPEELRDLVAAAHKLDIRVVLDIVVNHMCDKTFKTAYLPRRKAGDVINSQCADDLHKANQDGTEPSTRKQAHLEFAKEFFHPFRKQSFFNRCGPCTVADMKSSDSITTYGDFTYTMFDFNTRDHGFQELFTEIHKYWVAYLDIDGFRLDAAKHVTEDFLAYFSTEMRAYAASLGKKNFWIIGEVVGDEKVVARRLGAMGQDPQNPTNHGGYLEVPKALTDRLVQIKDTYLANEVFPLPGLNSAYNFYESGKAKATLHGADYDGHATGLEWYFNPKNSELTTMVGQLDRFCDKHSDHCAYGLSQFWTILEIHDWPRFIADFPHSSDMSLLGITWMMTAPGQPVVYYGLEQGFNGNCAGKVEDGNCDAKVELTKDNCARHGDWSLQDDMEEFCANDYQGDNAIKDRQDMFTTGPFRLGSAIASMNDLAGWAAPKPASKKQWQEDPMLSRDHIVFRTTRALAALRQSCKVLSGGAIEFRYAEDKAGGFFAFSRIPNMTYTGEHAELDMTAEGLAEVVVLLNPLQEAKLLNVDHLTKQIEVDIRLNPTSGLQYRDVLGRGNRGNLATTRVEGSKAYLDFEPNVEIPALGNLVLVREDHLLPFDEALGVSLCK